MHADVQQHYIEDSLRQLRKLKQLADAALAQTADTHFFEILDPESNSIALIIKHMAGNMYSRWRDFLTSDGEKTDRQRDREFETEARDTRASLMARWETGWDLTLTTIGALKPEDAMRTVTIRGEPHSVVEAINRQLCHYGYHVGQIVFLAKHLAGSSWRSLSIGRGQSEQWDVTKDGIKFAPEHGGRQPS